MKTNLSHIYLNIFNDCNLPERQMLDSTLKEVWSFEPKIAWTNFFTFFISFEYSANYEDVLVIETNENV